jgi:hypothetical protein
MTVPVSELYEDEVRDLVKSNVKAIADITNLLICT